MRQKSTKSTNSFVRHQTLFTIEFQARIEAMWFGKLIKKRHFSLDL
jgi:hypothetical protein